MVILRIKLLLFLISLQSSPSHLPSQFWFQCRFSVGDVKSMAVPQFWIISLANGWRDKLFIRLRRRRVTFIPTSSDLFSPPLSSYFPIWFIWFVQMWDQILGAIRTVMGDLMKPSIKAERAHNLFRGSPFVSLHNDGGRLLTQCCNFIWAQAALSTEEVSL